MVEVKNDFLRGKLFPMILKYSIPAAISLLITAIYNIVDRIFVGNFNGTSALAGLSICFPLSYMMMAFGLTCSAGGASLFSLFCWKKSTEGHEPVVWKCSDFGSGVRDCSDHCAVDFYRSFASNFWCDGDRVSICIRILSDCGIGMPISGAYTGFL